MTGTPKTQEMELKLTLDDPGDAERIVESLTTIGFEVSPVTILHNDDLYLDTFEWTLLKSGLALRFRRVDGRQFYTMKSVGTMTEGVADRFELEIPVGREIPDPTVVPVKQVRSRVDPVIWPRKLIEQVKVRTDRRTFTLTSRGGTRIELAFDSTRFQARGLNARQTAARLYELEAELIRGGAGELTRIARHVTERFACCPSEKSKLETAMERLKIRVPSKKPPEHLKVHRDDRIDLAVRKILSFQLRRIEEHLPGVHLDIDTEFVHQARVATRRMRSALRLFQGSLPNKTAEHFRVELGWIAEALGDVRDLDVFLLNLPRVFTTIESATPRQQMALERWVVDHRVTPLETLKAALASNRFRSLRSRLGTYLGTPLPKHPHGPLALKSVGETAPVIILEKYSAVISRGRKVLQNPRLKNFHKLRIQMKRLRYACEFVAPAYEESLDPFINRTVAIQDCLGELQDTVFTQAFIDRIIRDWKGKAVDPGLLFLLGEIYQLQSEIARARQAAFYGIWREFDRPEVPGELRSILGGGPEAANETATGEGSAEESQFPKATRA